MMRYPEKLLPLLPALLLALGTWAAEAHTQDLQTGRMIGMDFVVTRPLAEFGEQTRMGYGFEGNGLLRLGDRSPLYLRADGGFVIYGMRNSEMCYPAPNQCQATVVARTNNHIASLAIGPQLMVRLGDLRPYVQGGIGASYFGTATRVEGAYTGKEIENQGNQSDWTRAYTGGIGVLIPTGGTTAWDIGLRYHRNGEAEYMRPEDIQQHADGSITGTPTRGQTNFLTFRVGVSAGGN